MDDRRTTSPHARRGRLEFTAGDEEVRRRAVPRHGLEPASVRVRDRGRSHSPRFRGDSSPIAGRSGTTPWSPRSATRRWTTLRAPASSGWRSSRTRTPGGLIYIVAETGSIATAPAPAAAPDPKKLSPPAARIWARPAGPRRRRAGLHRQDQAGRRRGVRGPERERVLLPDPGRSRGDRAQSRASSRRRPAA